MAGKGAGIIVTANPEGKFEEGFVSGTPTPGTVMQIKAATEPIGGKYTYEVYNRDADGNRPQGPIFILLPYQSEGKTRDTAYVSGDRCFLYQPRQGDQLNMLVTATGTGTGDSQAIGDLYIIEDATGMLVATTGSPEIESFACLETVSDVVAGGTLVHVQFTGY